MPLGIGEIALATGLLIIVALWFFAPKRLIKISDGLFSRKDELLETGKTLLDKWFGVKKKLKAQ